MKAIDKLQKQINRSAFLGVICAILCVGIIFYTKNFNLIWWFLGFFVFIGYLNPIKCPFCTKSLIFPNGTTSLKKRGVKYCYQCGEDLNQKIKDKT